MNARDLANVALKVLGIYCFIQALPLLLQAALVPFIGLQNVESFNWKLQIIVMLLYVALYLIISYILVFRTAAVLRLMALGADAEGPVVNDSPPSYAPLAFSLLGAFFAISSIGHVLSNLIKLASQWKEASANYGMFREAILMNIRPDLIEHATKLILGIALMMGREKLGKLWKRMRPLAANGSANEQD
jgi:hypothetical protein